MKYFEQKSLELKAHQKRLKHQCMKEMFQEDPGRAKRFSIEWDGLFFDYSKHLIDDAVFECLHEWVNSSKINEERLAMFSGKKINHTEGRSVLHVALRQPLDPSNLISQKVHDVLGRMRSFCENIYNGSWKGYTGKIIRHIVNIGIGGSDLGPHMTYQALSSWQKNQVLNFHFVSNVDGQQLRDVLEIIPPEETLFIIASKTFTTQETMLNANSARTWFLAQKNTTERDISRHFIALSTNIEAAAHFGIDSDQCFAFWDWVGGRYSIWSAIGLPLMLAIGPKYFDDFLAGAHAMDQHFLNEEFPHNIPMIMAILGLWYSQYWGTQTHLILPYDYRLRRFPAYIQQLDMESNGKSTLKDGSLSQHPTGSIVWGETGINGQHAFFQLLHQGSHLIPMDFIGSIHNPHSLPGHHQLLLSNMLAQSEALMQGQSINDAYQDLCDQGMPEDQAKILAPHKYFPGNRPSSTLLLDECTPYHLGQLIALYEHKVFVQGVMLGVYSFDQWGVELGKKLAKDIEQNIPKNHDSSTAQLIRRCLSHYDE
jgi:glucose-6-phosphate isomerase